MLANLAVLLSTSPDGRVRAHPAARRLSGVGQVRGQVPGHAAYWQQRAAEPGTGPLWVVLGDSAGQAIGTPDPALGYVGRVSEWLSERDGVRWRVVNLCDAGALTADVLGRQLPRLGAFRPDLVSCGVGANDILRTPPTRLRAQLAAVAAGLPRGSVLLTLTAGLRGVGRRYLGWLNTGIRAAAAEHGHLVADVEAAFGPPYRGKFSPDGFHPSAAGYADWAAAVRHALPSRSGPPIA